MAEEEKQSRPSSPTGDNLPKLFEAVSIQSSSTRPIPVLTGQLFLPGVKQPMCSERYVDKGELGFTEACEVAERHNIGSFKSDFIAQRHFPEMGCDYCKDYLREQSQTVMSVDDWGKTSIRFLNGEIPAFCGHYGPIHPETDVIGSELRALVRTSDVCSIADDAAPTGAAIFPTDSQPFIAFQEESTKESYAQKPYCGMIFSERSAERLVRLVGDVSGKLNSFNESSSVKIGIVDYGCGPSGFENQEMAEQLYYTSIMFCVIPPDDDSSSEVWAEFFEFCHSRFWSSLRDIVMC